MPRRSAPDWIMEVLALTALAAIIGLVAAHWTELPPKVPGHFGISGLPDRWGNKTSLLQLPAVATSLYVLLTLASRYQSLINIPMSIDRDAPPVRRILQSMSITLKLVTLLIFLRIEWTLVHTALGHTSGLGTLFLPITLVAVFLPLGVYLRALHRHQQ